MIGQDHIFEQQAIDKMMAGTQFVFGRGYLITRNSNIDIKSIHISCCFILGNQLIERVQSYLPEMI